MRDRMKMAWGVTAPKLAAGLRALRRGLALYLDDLLMLAGGVCFVSAAAELGRGAALAVAGVCLVAYAVVIARARRGGGAR